MKIAGLIPYTFLPYHSGGQKSIAQFYEYLGKTAEVTVIGTQGNDSSLGGNYSLLPVLPPGKSRYFNPFLFFRIRKLLNGQGIKTIIFEHPYYAWLLWLLKKAGFRVVLHTHNIEYTRFRSVKKWWWPLLKRYERFAFRQADIAFFISREDMEYALADFMIPADKCHVIPFGIPERQPPPAKDEIRDQLLRQWKLTPGTALLIFTGHYSYQPNIDAVADIVNHVAPLLNDQWTKPYKIIITGKGLPAPLQQLIADREDMVYAGFVDNIESYFTGADILLNTVLTGGGVKTKLIEAIGHGTSVVSTAAGALGVDPEACTGKLFISENGDWESFAADIRANAFNENTTSGIFYQHYYWGNIVSKVIRILSEHA